MGTSGHLLTESGRHSGLAAMPPSSNSDPWQCALQDDRGAAFISRSDGKGMMRSKQKLALAVVGQNTLGPPPLPLRETYRERCAVSGVPCGGGRREVRWWEALVTQDMIRPGPIFKAWTTPRRRGCRNTMTMFLARSRSRRFQLLRHFGHRHSFYCAE